MGVMAYGMFSFPQCARCGGEQEAYEVTTYGDAVPQYVPGRCRECGYAGPIVTFAPCSCLFHDPYGPAVPTPDDLLRAAGLLV